LKLIVTGASGLVGRAIVSHVASQGETVLGFDHAGLDISDGAAIENHLLSERPDVVVNCAAWTDVDGCESNREHALAANAQGPELLARASRQIDALFIHISTDYVFDGTKQGFYTQEDEPNPISVYGVSKLEGERRALAAWTRTIVVRSGYIFGVGGTNFLSTLVARASRGEPLMAITDMQGTPTYAPDLAGRILDLARLDRPDLYHVVNAGDGVTFADFAASALEKAGLEDDLLQPITLDSLARPAPRPRNSRLRCLISEGLGLEPLPHWQDSLSQFIAAD
jgi:dTDP-4-dehydrorhamnose reductase